MPTARADQGRRQGRPSRAYDDTEALDRFAAEVDVITYEFENLPTEAFARMGQKGAGAPALALPGDGPAPG